MTNPPIEHPSWCDPNACTMAESISRHHVSAPLELDTDPVKAISVAIRITQTQPNLTEPCYDRPAVEFAFRYPRWDPEAEDKEYCLPFTGEQAHALGRLLTTAGREAST